RKTIQSLAQRFIEALEQLIAYCRLPHVGGYTPADFPLAQLNQVQLDSLTQQIRVGAVPVGIAYHDQPENEKPLSTPTHPALPVQGGKLAPKIPPLERRQRDPRQQIEEIYPLSPMQAGLLFQSLYTKDAGIYCTQFGWTIRGRVHVEAWKWAWQEVV